MGQIGWTNRVRSVRNEILYGVKEERNSLRTVKIRELYWIGHNSCRSCFLYHVMEGKLEGRIEMA